MALPMHDDYTIAWICALPSEVAAAKVMLDEIHQTLPKPTTDPNAYILGSLHGHHIVIACLPTGIYGTISAAAIVTHLMITFPHVQYALLVGIGGGVPSSRNDIRLGDVVVSKPAGHYGGVVQYDFGKTVQGGRFEQTGMLNAPPQVLLTHMASLQANQMTGDGGPIPIIVADVLERYPDIKKEFQSPGHHADYFFRASYHHIEQESDCEQCDKRQLVCREPRDNTTPHVHYGLIASGDQVMKDSETRDSLAQQLGILCFEMEAAGLMNQLPTLVIRGICDYCDSHKQKQWQGYAALTAAAYAKSLLSIVPVRRMNIDETESKKRQHWMVPLARNPNFVGRQHEIAKVEEWLTMRDGPRKIAITGLGGVGKTQVALELAHRIRDRDQECSIFWIPCTSRAMVEQTFQQMAQILGLDIDVDPLKAKQKVKSYLSSERVGKWFLILDNADDAEMWLTGSHAVPPLEDFLPDSGQGRLLFTSRNRKLAMRLAPFTIVSIPDVDEDTAAKILEKTLGYKDLLRESTTSALFLQQLAFLPLAITQASAYIIENDISLSAYLALLQEQEQDAVELLSEDFRDPGRYKDIQNPVITTWLISFKQIQHQNQLAADYLSFMACIDPRNIPRSLLPLPASKKQVTDALGLLNAYSFTNGPQDMNINMHRLVHIATRNWLRKNALFSYWVQRVADHIQHIFPDNHHTKRGLWREYLPHALVLVHETEFIVHEKNYLSLIENVADCLASDGRYQQAEIFYKKLVIINQAKMDAKDSFDTLTSIANLASIYWDQGRWTEAEKLEVQVMETRKIVLGDEHPDTLTIMENLALTYWNQGRWNEAEKLEMQVLEIRKRVLGDKNPDILITMANLALIYWDQGRWNEAEKLEVQVMETRKTLSGDEHPDTLTSMANLASTYWNQGRWNEAEKLEVQVLETRKIVLGDEHPDTLTSMANLASTYRDQGRLTEAEKLEVQVMETRKTVLGDEHPNTLTSMANLALTYWNQGRWTEAEKLEVQVLETRKIVLGDEHPDTLSSVRNIALTYRAQGQLDEAEKLGVQAVEISKKVLGDEHPDTLTSMNDLAYTWKFQGKTQDALTLIKKCFGLRSKVLGPRHPDSKLSFRALTDWNNENKELPNQPPPTGNDYQQSLRDLLEDSPAKVLITQSIHGAHFNLPFAQRRSATKSFFRDHPFIIAARAPSLEAGGQDLQEVD